VEALRAAFLDTVSANTWLTPQAREAAIAKVRAVALKVGYPDAWPDVGTFPISRTDYLQNVLAARQFEQLRDWKRAQRERRRDTWESLVRPWGAEGMAAARLMIPNGFPDGYSNSIFVTAAHLVPPDFDASAPKEITYGSFGRFMGHELIHVLDNHEFDANGDLHDPWTPADVEVHKKRSRCVVEQANAVTLGELHLDGETTVWENVADLSGLQLAYVAMAKDLRAQLTQRGADGLTTAQRFFYGYARHQCAAIRPEVERKEFTTDIHGPRRFRVNGPLANMPEFAQAFGCAPTAKMVRPPAQRCSVW
jgi:predicted metalloendopeptidase